MATSTATIAFTKTADVSPTRSQLSGLSLALARVAWILTSVVLIGLFVAALPAYFQQRATPADGPLAGPFQIATSEAAILRDAGVSMEVFAAILGGSQLVFAAVWMIGGLILFVRRSNHWIVIFTSLFMILFATFSGAPYSVPSVLVSANPSLGFITDLYFAVLGVMLVYFLYMFPNGRFEPRWTRIAAIVWIGVVFVPVIAPNTPLDYYQNPAVFGVVDLLGLGSGVIAQVIRYRKISIPVERQQTKVFVYGLVTMAVISLLPLPIVPFVPQLSSPGLARLLFTAYFQILGFGVGVSFWGATLIVSILRYRLWDVDLVINRSAVYGALTALLGGVFVALFMGVQQLLSLLNFGMQTPLALATAATVIAIMFQPARSHLQSFVDRRFYKLAIGLNNLSGVRKTAGDSAALEGQMIGKYVLERPVGQGGMGKIYLASDPENRRKVAIKVLAGQHVANTESRLRFEREARLLSQFDHPNIVRLYDFGEHEDMPFMALEYIEGSTLKEMIDQRVPLPLTVARAMLTELGSALDHAHAQGLVHRDVKPSNILLRTVAGNRVEVALTDFGIARVIDSNTGLTNTGMMGTLDYLAPEQIQSSGTVDRHADIYAMGIVAYQILTGELPFKGNNAQILFAHLYQPAPDLRYLHTDVPGFVADAVMRALSKQPDSRFDTAGAFAAALA